MKRVSLLAFVLIGLLAVPARPVPAGTMISKPMSMSFQDFERGNGTPPGQYFWEVWYTTCSFSEPPLVLKGRRAVRVEANAQARGGSDIHGGTMGIIPASNDPLDLSAAATISIWVYDTQGGNTIELKLRDIKEQVSNAVWSTMHTDRYDWTLIAWDLADFEGVDKSRIKNIELYEWDDGVYYFDDVTYQVPPPTPPPPSRVFQDFEKDNGTPPGQYFWEVWHTTCAFSASPSAHSGKRAVRVWASAEEKGWPGSHGGTMGIIPAAGGPVDLSGATTLSVWIYDTQGNNTLELKLRDIFGNVSDGVWSTMSAFQDQWTQVTWDLDDFEGVDKSRVKNIELYEWNDGVYYFDGVTYEAPATSSGG